MMDFDNVLSLATQNRGDSSVQKRYSLQTGPPKKDPKSKGVSSAAIQALLKKKQIENKMKVIERKKQKEELLAKRVEKKTDRKARAMASRTKDNFHGYNAPLNQVIHNPDQEAHHPNQNRVLGLEPVESGLRVLDKADLVMEDLPLEEQLTVNMVGSKAGVPPRPGMPSQQRPGILQQQRPGMSQQRPGMSQQRPGMSQQQQRPGMAQQRPGMSQQQRPGMSQQQRPGMSQQQRPGMSQQQRPGMSQQQRPGMSQQQRPGMSQQQRPGMSQQQRPGIPPRPMNRPPGPMLPPITSAYKRKFEDEEDEYDSEMDDFIDDGDDDQESISQHIKQIFGYDRNKYKDESDYALRFMESSWKDMQKEEARSLRMAVQEDLEEERKEEEEFKRQNAKKPRKK
uniref:Protein SPT2 homolog n=1 Tax=Knipowitschia caucasica TaxID=637954 RepID=A0AAV2L742_KNICA